VTICDWSLGSCHICPSVTKRKFLSQMCLYSVTIYTSSWKWFQYVTIPFGHRWNTIFVIITSQAGILTAPLTTFSVLWRSSFVTDNLVYWSLPAIWKRFDGVCHVADDIGTDVAVDVAHFGSAMCPHFIWPCGMLWLVGIFVTDVLPIRHTNNYMFVT
jgi:hypothetical protein